ncbi:hypothetical protein DAPPUDRAFT_309195 [Daphnia pulex]|uniref:Uncharacterized protein n=1 Tax=Daphnia pulex TaxID=6669 RepID=E9HAT4_DAPPU|nr:hypothetical protein DAPPUDRAFT_309195 [Daphnia pulex]|eukprot:EFX71161.1 hypothetical protein DAPPUDRAFT_309195 [Daphnia pulex]
MNNANTIHVMFSPKELKNSKIFNATCKINVPLGLASIFIQLSAMVISVFLDSYIPYGFDDIGFGIWAGISYFMAGSFGMAASSKQRKWRLTTTILVSAFALGASIVSATLSGMAASLGVLPGCENSEYGKSCGPWVGLEWSLMAVSVLAAISSVVLILCASDVLCCGNYSRHNIATTTVSRQQVIHFGNGRQHPQQSGHFKPVAHQQVSLNVQQLPTFQVSYVPQITQHSQPQQVLVTAPVVAPAIAPATVPALQQVQVHQ